MDNLTSLRDRIAAILHAHTLAENDPVFWRCCCTAYSDSFKDDYIAHDAHVADAVLAELGLRREWGIREATEPEPGWLSDTRDDFPPQRPGETRMTRYITAWEDDDE